MTNPAGPTLRFTDTDTTKKKSLDDQQTRWSGVVHAERVVLRLI
jgi:hypothetical protein